jgi:asparagine synthase (glutamine-hydrolysing)
MSPRSVIADFVLASGPGASAWLSSLPDLKLQETGNGPWQLATRGDPYLFVRPDGGGCVALADLAGGDVAQLQRASSQPETGWRGRFACADWHADGRTVEIVSDHFGSIPLYWIRLEELTAIATDLRLLLDAPGLPRAPDPTAIYHYLNFGCIPAPLTICTGIRRLEPGTRLALGPDASHARRYYLPEYPADLGGPDAVLAAELRGRIVRSVEDFRPGSEDDWACFLSGGTDSSSIVSILASGKGSVHSCSIGFAEAGYDELDFARLAGEACGATTHTLEVDRDRSLALLDTVVEAYDQPFGNASAVPTLACAELGRGEGFGIMLGGDGGDEIFGGNQRYAKDKVMEAFYRLPAPIKRSARAIGRAIGGGNNHLLNRIENFTERASLPNPERFYTDDSFASDYYGNLLTDDFRAHVGKDASLDFMRAVYEQGGEVDPLHAIMRLDLMMAIAQNDLVKVHRACKQHGVVARFPYLDPRLVEYCGRLPAGCKVRGLDKRYLFKRAMADILPRAILRKRKQGFGLPIAVWMKDDPAFRERVRAVLLDDTTRQRGWVNPDFIARLVEEHMAGGWDHAAALWQLLVLELWMRRYLDAA